MRIGEPAVELLVETLQRKNADVEADAKKAEVCPRHHLQKAAILLGDPGSKKAGIPALLAELQKKDDGLDFRSRWHAGVSGDIKRSFSRLVRLAIRRRPRLCSGTVLSDGKRDPKHRCAAAEGSEHARRRDGAADPLGIAKTPF